MKKLIIISCIGLGLFFLGQYFFDQKPEYSFHEFPIGTSVKVEVTLPNSAYEELTEREQQDQVKDWLLLSILSNIDLDLEDFNEITFDTPALRYGYSHDMSNLEFGETRSKYIGDQSIVGLIPKCTELERLDYLAEIADKHRKDLDIIPKVIHVFEYDINLEENVASVTRIKEADAKNLFTETAGYYEKEIKQLSDLEWFIGKIHDLTYATWLSNGNLKVGGRKLQSRSYGTLEVEDIAAIYQSEITLTQNQKEFKEKWDKIYSENSLTEEYLNNFIEKELRKLGIDPNQLVLANQLGENSPPIKKIRQKLDSLEYAYRIRIERLNEEEIRDAKKQKIVDGSGFSLDPTYDFNKIISVVEYYSEIFKGLSEKYQSIINSLQEEDIDPLYLAIGEIISFHPENAEKAESLLEEIRVYNTYQKARYDGLLQGTKVGMSLFYTDLLAKIWRMNYDLSAPKLDIEDFTCDTDVRVSKVFDEEKIYDSARLWFGPDESDIQLANENKKLFFARCATKIYSASSNLLEPGKEVPVSAFWGASTNWWNDHFEEVAEFEPEYERLNEIIKWSTVISWLNHSSQLYALNFLRKVEVERELWFPDWVKKQSNLRFKEWDQVHFFEEGFLGNNTEVMIKLSSFVLADFSIISGGVTLKPQINKITSAPSKRADKIFSHRPSYKTDLATGKYTSPKGNSFIINKNRVVAEAPKEFKVRFKFGELPNKPIDRVITKNKNLTKINTSQSGRDIGTLNVKKIQNGFATGFESRALDRGHHIAKQLSDSKNPIEFLKQSADVDNFLVPDGSQALNFQVGETYVLPKNSTQWMKIEIGSAPSLDISNTSILRVAGNKPTSKICDIKAVSEQTIDDLLQQKGLKLYRPRGDLPSSKNWADASKYQENLNAIDGSIAKGEYGIAYDGLSQMAKAFGKTNPEIYFKKGLASAQESIFLFKNGTVSQGVNRINRGIVNNKPLKGNKDFYEQVNAFIKESKFSEHNKSVLDNLMQFQFLENVKIFSKVDVSRIIGKGKRVEPKILMKSVSERRGKVFIQDHPYLSNLDWSPSTTKSLNTIIESYPEAIIEQIPNNGNIGLRLGNGNSNFGFGGDINLNIQLARFGRGANSITKNEGGGFVLSPDSTQMKEPFLLDTVDYFIIYLPEDYVGNFDFNNFWDYTSTENDSLQSAILELLKNMEENFLKEN